MSITKDPTANAPAPNINGEIGKVPMKSTVTELLETPSFGDGIVTHLSYSSDGLYLPFGQSTHAVRSGFLVHGVGLN